MAEAISYDVYGHTSQEQKRGVDMSQVVQACGCERCQVVIRSVLTCSLRELGHELRHRVGMDGLAMLIREEVPAARRPRRSFGLRRRGAGHSFRAANV